MTAPNVTPPAPPAPSPTTPPTGAAPTGGTPTPASSATPTPAEQTGFRFSSGALAGKTTAEAATLADQMYQRLQQQTFASWGGGQGAASAPQGYAPSQQPAPTPVAPAARPEPPKNEDWLNNPGEAAQRYAAYLQATQFAPQQLQTATMLAQSNKALVQMQRQDDFRRWGPEIELALQQYAPSPEAWTPQNLTAVVDIVKARHVQELVEEELTKRGQAGNALGGASLRPSAAGGTGTSASAPNVVDFDGLPPGYRDVLRSLNVEQHTIDEFLVRTYVRAGIEPDLDAARARWIKQVKRGDVFSDNRQLESTVYGRE